MTTSSPDEIQGTIRLTRFPSALGYYTDVDGQQWDIRGIIGGKEGYVQAVKREGLHAYYTDTSGVDHFAITGTDGSGGVVSQRWRPYKVEVVKDV